MVKTKSEARRSERDAKIIQLWNTIKIVGGSKKSAAAEEIAGICETSVTTVNRVAKSHYGVKF